MIDTLLYVHHHVAPAALSLLPGKLDTMEARAMLLSIGLQESEFAARTQGGGGPAHGFWQFERNGGVKEVLESVSLKAMLAPVLHTLGYRADVAACYTALIHNDVLAYTFARLLLWTIPGRLPAMNEPNQAWLQYESAWRPGKPRPKVWGGNFQEAWRVVLHE